MNNNKTLFRDREKGKIAGVCAGIADYFHFEIWLVRVIAVSIFLLGGSGLVFVLYIALWMILDVKPKPKNEDLTVDHDLNQHNLKQKVWQSGDSAKQALNDVANQFSALELRLQNLESHITSEQFDLKRQINNL